MTQKKHRRTVVIVTVTATCDECGDASPPSKRETLLGWGWRLMERGDLCPDCHEVACGIERQAAENEARARYIAAIESGEPPLVHGRVYGEKARPA